MTDRKYHSYEVHIFGILGNREQGTGNREEIIFNRDAVHQDTKSKSKNNVPHNCDKCKSALAASTSSSVRGTGF
ncbi:MAG: hypothetical protein F6K26_20730 [Moorea sp. SIO2I5]|nr:hypothetical protein [Moorena sp. SIO2I5]